MNKKVILISLLSVFGLSACELKEGTVFSRSDYNDPIFENNYYRVKEEGITKNILRSNVHELDDTENKVFKTYDELKALEIDRAVNTGEVTYDSLIYSNYNTTYGDRNRLGNLDDSFNKGIYSKLTDGLLFCDGKTFQGVRVQIDQEGFIHGYDKYISHADYFALSFKAGSDYTSPLYPKSATYDIKLKIAFYTPNYYGWDLVGFEERIYTYTLNSIVRDKYYLFGFYLELFEKQMDDIAGIGISYELLNTTEDPQLKHCLHLYETLFVGAGFGHVL